MGYDGPHSLPLRCLFEFLAAAQQIFAGLSVIQNHLLPHTKGTDSGFDSVARGYSLSIFLVGIIYGYVSSYVNPAILLAQLIQGRVTGLDFIVLATCQFAGAFFGSILIYYYHATHFKTVPEPPATSQIERMSRRRDNAGPCAQRYCTTRARTNVNRYDSFSTILSDALYYFDGSKMDKLELFDRHLENVHVPNELYRRLGVRGGPDPARRRSINVADLQRLIIKHQVERIGSPVHRLASPRRSTAIRRGAPGNLVWETPLEDDDGKSKCSFHDEGEGQQGKGGQPDAQGEGEGIDVSLLNDEQKALYDELLESYAQAIAVDHAIKLSCFASKPAIYSPVFNYLQEVVATGFLTFTSLQIAKQLQFLPDKFAPLKYVLQPFLGSLTLYGLIVALGGPTGFAGNPARDFGPRLAHYVLNIPGKGSSMWSYGLGVPLTATFVGGAIAGAFDLLYNPVEEIFANSR